MSTTFLIASGADDGYLPAAGGFDSAATILEFGQRAAGTGYEHAFFRFVNVAIPNGSTIASCILHLKAPLDDTRDTVNVAVYFNASDDAIAPTDRTEYLALALSTGIAWNAVAHSTAGVWYDTPELATILQEIVDRVGWASGNALQVLIKDISSDADKDRIAYTYDNAPTDAATLEVTFTAPSFTGDLNCNSPRYSSSGWGDTGPVGNTGAGDISIPSLSALGTGLVPISSSITGTAEAEDMVLPAFTCQAYTGFYANLAADLPSYSIQMKAGGSIVLTLPSFLVSSSIGHTPPHGNTDLELSVLPSFTGTGVALNGFVGRTIIGLERSAYTCSAHWYIVPVGVLQQSFPRAFICSATGEQSGVFDSFVLDYDRE